LFALKTKESKMSEYELSELSADYLNGAMGAISLYITVVTAYLVAAFSAGKRLNSSEYLIVTVLFVLSASFFIFGSVALLSRQLYIVEKLAAIESDATVFLSKTLIMYIAAVEILGVFAGLKFMWSIRRRDS
jgi:hypothetical protein